MCYITWTNKLRTGTGFLTHTPLIDIRQHGPSNAACRIDLRRAQQAKNMPRGYLSATRAEHLWNTERARTRAPASRAHPRPAGESHARIALPTPICAMFLDSKMRPRIVLRQAEHRVSIGQALSGVRQKCVRCVRQHTCSRCMPTWISAPQVGRGSCDPLQPFWSCPRLTCGDGDPTEEELGS
jgi:hypothetical protein